jgi:uncharacterized protein YbjT (DUF2867 family)
MILVTGAAGKTGQAVIRALHKRKKPIRAWVHKDNQIQLVQVLGVQEVIAGDMCSQKTMNQVLQGVSAVYHICPNVSPEEFNIGQIVIKAAQSAEVDHFVYHSVLHPRIESMPHHWQKMRVEEQLFESGLSCTILQPAPYMQNILAYWNDIMKKNRYVIPYSKNTRLSSVDLEDAAEVAAIVLCESGHKGAIYELCGKEILSQIEITQILSQYMGHRVDVKVIPIEEWEANARNMGLDDYQVRTLIKMFRYYEQFGFVGNSRILECLLNRPPTSYATFIERTIRERQ